MGDFFAVRQPAAVLKHELLSRYLRVYVQKTGSRSKDRRVAYVDCYAGPGVYDDGSQGSPAIAVALAEIVRRSSAQVDGYFIEKDRATCDELGKYLADADLEWPVRHGTVEEKLPEILDEIDPATSMFVFLDPFGLGVPMELIQRILERGGRIQYGHRVKGAATEVLLNFSFPGLVRNAGHLTSRSRDTTYLKSRETILARVDATVGGDWWREIWLSEAGDRKELILRGYLERLARLPGGWGWWSIPVSDRWNGPADYSLIQLTQHEDGKWEILQALSNALEPYRKACFEDAGQMDLEPLADREAQWIAEIKKNLEQLLSSGNAFILQDKLSDVFSATLGFTREKHLRSAIKELHAEGKTGFNGKGPLQRARITPP